MREDDIETGPRVSEGISEVVKFHEPLDSVKP
jgi:hypothetical protein